MFSNISIFVVTNKHEMHNVSKLTRMKTNARIPSQLIFTHEKEHRSVEVKRIIIMVNNHNEKTQQQTHSNV